MIRRADTTEKDMYFEQGYSLGRLSVLHPEFASYHYSELKDLLKWARKYRGEELTNYISKAALQGKRDAQKELGHRNHAYDPGRKRKKPLTRKPKRKKMKPAKRSKPKKRPKKNPKISPQKQAFIQKKVRLLLKEGYPRLQAFAIAYRMAGVPRPNRPVRHLTPKERKQSLKARRRALKKR